LFTTICPNSEALLDTKPIDPMYNLPHGMIILHIQMTALYSPGAHRPPVPIYSEAIVASKPVWRRVFEFYSDAVDINRVRGVNKLSIIIFAPEVYKGALGGIDWHYKCGHIIATLHSNVIVYDFGDIYALAWAFLGSGHKAQWCLLLLHNVGAGSPEQHT